MFEGGCEDCLTYILGHFVQGMGNIVFLYTSNIYILFNNLWYNLADNNTYLNCLFHLQLFHTDDFELQYLQNGHCPFCRHKLESWKERDH